MWEMRQCMKLFLVLEGFVLDHFFELALQFLILEKVDERYRYQKENPSYHEQIEGSVEFQ